jgi:DNA-binding MarR family transcriptional regulator
VPDELVSELVRHSRLLQLLKAHATGWAPAGLDGAAFGILITVVKCGPRRQGELADTALLDPSTVSRYVAQLVRAGLVTRQPDPVDGRAVHLVATAEGVALAQEALRRRRAMIESMLEGWSPDDAATLVRLLRRLNDEMESRRESFDAPARAPGA